MHVNRRKKSGSGSGRRSKASLFIFLLIIVIISCYILLRVYEDYTARHREQHGAVRSSDPVNRQMPLRPNVKLPLETYTTSLTAALPQEKTKTRNSQQLKGIVAIVIDDMGSSLDELDLLTRLHIPLTFAIIPQLPLATEIALRAHDRGYEVIVHMPMEPKGYPELRMEKNGLLMSLTDAEIEIQAREYLALVPYAAGANNHMGSRFTEDAGKLLPVMQVLKEKRLYFLDSKTTPLSLGSSLAHEVGIKSGSRNVFLDNVQDVEAIRDQLQFTVRIARKQGKAIAICHPHKATIIALSQTLPALKAEGVIFVKLSQVIEKTQ